MMARGSHRTRIAATLAAFCAVTALPLTQGGSAMATGGTSSTGAPGVPWRVDAAGRSPFDGTVVGGLSSITYDTERDLYYAISDDQGSLGPVRFYTLDIDVADGSLDPGDVTVVDVTALEPPAGESYAPGTVDPEGLTLTADDTVVVTSEGVRRCRSEPLDPGVRAGWQLRTRPHRAGAIPGGSRLRRTPEPRLRGGRSRRRPLPVHRQRGRPYAGRASGNADERLSSPALAVPPRFGAGRPHVRLSGRPRRGQPVPPSAFSVNGLVELLPLNNQFLLAMERSFSVGVGNSVSLHLVGLPGADDVSGLDSLVGAEV